MLWGDKISHLWTKKNKLEKDQDKWNQINIFLEKDNLNLEKFNNFFKENKFKMESWWRVYWIDNNIIWNINFIFDYFLVSNVLEKNVLLEVARMKYLDYYYIERLKKINEEIDKLNRYYQDIERKKTKEFYDELVLMEKRKLEEYIKLLKIKEEKQKIENFYNEIQVELKRYIDNIDKIKSEINEIEEFLYPISRIKEKTTLWYNNIFSYKNYIRYYYDVLRINKENKWIKYFSYDQNIDEVDLIFNKNLYWDIFNPIIDFVLSINKSINDDNFLDIFKNFLDAWKVLNKKWVDFFEDSFDEKIDINKEFLVDILMWNNVFTFYKDNKFIYWFEFNWHLYIFKLSNNFYDISKIEIKDTLWNKKQIEEFYKERIWLFI